ncbi:helix-turn-helix transcriptional regulator [Microbacterium murale]|uniref:helix-turn-helix transcriptional regulator n=1 Tax=Microbacterium murale TaxID=1081040 RepID=UPI0016650843|nr:AraC family transcriptional regulator [Microbacterium murale]
MTVDETSASAPGGAESSLGAFARDGGPVLVGANTYDFRSAERIRNDVVATVCYAWVVSGRGMVRTGSLNVEVGKGSALWLPWRHGVRWEADTRHPFTVGTVHIVPWHSAKHAVVARAPFGDDALMGVDFRRGESGEPIVLTPPNAVADTVSALGGYAIDRFARGSMDEELLRSLGTLLHEEYLRAAAGHAVSGPQPPLAFQRMCDYVEQNLHERLSVADVARAGDCSSSTAERLFVRWARTSVSTWVRDRRMDRAVWLLTSSGLRVSEVARAVGFQDPLYFSRVFSTIFGQPPSRYGSGRIRP